MAMLIVVPLLSGTVPPEPGALELDETSLHATARNENAATAAMSTVGGGVLVLPPFTLRSVSAIHLAVRPCAASGTYRRTTPPCDRAWRPCARMAAPPPG